MENKKFIVVDIDGVLCTEERTFDKPLAKPLESEISKLNDLYYAGHFIFLHSARSWSEYRTTVEWLNKHNVKYTVLVLGKPYADYLVDDRAFRSISELIDAKFKEQA